jgi:hypothetical protein
MLGEMIPHGNQKNIDMSFPTNYVDGLVFAIQATV